MDVYFFREELGILCKSEQDREILGSRNAWFQTLSENTILLALLNNLFCSFQKLVFIFPEFHFEGHELFRPFSLVEHDTECCTEVLFRTCM